jgi:hypothetical protein
MPNLIRIKRGTRAQLNAAVTGNTLSLGEPYLITDENRIAVGTGSNSYETFAKATEVQALDADLNAIAALTGTGYLRRTGTDTWTLENSTFLTAESDTLATVTGRGATTSTAITATGGITVNTTGSSNGVIFNGTTSGNTKLQASAVAGATTITLPATTGTVALTGDVHFIGTTSVSLSRASANLALTGISSVSFPGATSGAIVLQPTSIAGTNTITLPASTGTVALTTDIPTVNNGTLTLSMGAAAASGATVTVGTGTGFSANTATNSTYSLSVGPALTALATFMTTATAGFIRRTGVDTFAVDTNTYLTGNQSISLTGDITGTGTTSIATTLATVNSNVGTFTKVTVNAKGLVTAATTLADTDIPTLTAAKISNFDTQVRTSRLDQMAAPTAAVAFNNQRITGLAEPSAAQDAATKNYVDSAIQGLDPKASVRVATTADLGTVAYNNGTAGVGATITNTGTLAALSIDGVALSVNDRVLVKDQTAGLQNGIYTVTTVGSGAVAWVLTRATDNDTWAEIPSTFVFVEQGTNNADNGYLFTADQGGTMGTTAITVTQFSGAGQITAGNGLTKTGNTINVVGTASRIVANADSIDIDSGYVGQTSITTLGTVTTGTWNATTIAVSRGGTGVTTLTGLVKGNGTSAFSAAVAGTDYLAPNSTIDGGTF